MHPFLLACLSTWLVLANCQDNSNSTSTSAEGEMDEAIFRNSLIEELKKEVAIEESLCHLFQQDPLSELTLLFRGWDDPPEAFRKKIKLTPKQNEIWKALKHFVGPGDRINPLETRFCNCRGKREVMSEDVSERVTYERKLTSKRSLRTKRAPCELPVQRLERKEWRRMSAAMRTSFTNAINSLATYIPDPVGAPDVSLHDIFVMWHRFSESPGAHGGAAFLPWHREYLFRFENALRDRGYTGALPYWDSGLDAPLPDPTGSAIWSSQHLGTSRGSVTTPFQSVTALPDCRKDGPRIRRSAAIGATTSLFSRSKVQDVQAKECYRELTWEWDTSFESYHNTVHGWFGNSHMGNLNCAPTDPVFWMHHCFVDHVWETFRVMKQQDWLNREKDYPTTNFGTADMAWNSPLKPFHSLRVIDGLRMKYTNIYYSYEQRPSSIACTSDADCNGPDGAGLLWCDVPARLCYAKIQVGELCNINWPANQCWCTSGTPLCNLGRCSC